MVDEMTEALFYFFLVIGPSTGDEPATLARFGKMEECRTQHAAILADKDTDWLLKHLVTPCGSYPAVLVPKTIPAPDGRAK